MNKDSLTKALAHFILELERSVETTGRAEDRPLYTKFLAAAAVTIAKVVEDRPIDNDINAMERLFGNIWFEDKNAYMRIYEAWDSFKSLLTKSIHGMTVNERLFHLGLFEEVDKAVAERDEAKLRAVLFKCFLDEDSIEAIIENKLKRSE